MSEEKLFWVQDDTNNGPWDDIPVIDPVREAELLAKSQAHWNISFEEPSQREKSVATA